MHLKPKTPMLPYSNTPFRSHASARQLTILTLCALLATIVVVADTRAGEVKAWQQEWQKSHHHADPEKRYLFRYVGSVQLGQVYYNTRLVNPKEFNSFWDFLNPKWRGKIEARDIRAPGTGGSAIRLFYYNPEVGPEFV